MKLIIKFVNAFYFITWILFLTCAYAFLTDKYYITGKMFGQLLGAVALGLYSIVILILIIAFLTKQINSRIIKKKLLVYSAPLLLLLPVVIISLLPNKLEPDQHTIEVSYTAWGCDCANWSLNVDNGRPVKNDAFNREHVFIEPANSNIALPSRIGKTGDVIQLTGQFYQNKGFPKGYSSPEFPEKERVFRYTGYKIIDSRDVLLGRTN